MMQTQVCLQCMRCHMTSISRDWQYVTFGVCIQKFYDSLQAVFRTAQEVWKCCASAVTTLWRYTNMIIIVVVGAAATAAVIIINIITICFRPSNWSDRNYKKVCACRRHTISYWSTHGSDDSLAGYQATAATTEELTADCCDRQRQSSS